MSKKFFVSCIYLFICVEYAGLGTVLTVSIDILYPPSSFTFYRGAETGYLSSGSNIDLIRLRLGQAPASAPVTFPVFGECCFQLLLRHRFNQARLYLAPFRSGSSFGSSYFSSLGECCIHLQLLLRHQAPFRSGSSYFFSSGGCCFHLQLLLRHRFNQAPFRSCSV